jgi:hypothetical protein
MSNHILPTRANAVRRSGIITASALAGLAIATCAGCSSGSSPSAAARPKITAAAAGSTTHATASPTSSTAASSAPSTDAGSSSVCSLLTAGQASRLNKVTYSSATASHPTSGYDTCTYKNTGSADPIDIQNLTVSVLSIPGCWTGLQSADGSGKALPGVGDAAFGAQIGIDVKAGSQCISIRGLTHAELLGNYGPDVAMAKIILANLH